MVVAWSHDAATGNWTYWRPDDPDSTLAVVRPGSALLVRLEKAATFESGIGQVSAPALPDGSPPMLVLGRVDEPFAYRLQGGRVEARTDGRVVASAWLGRDGGYRMLVPGDDGDTVVLDHYGPDGEGLGSSQVTFASGAVAQPILGRPSLATPAPQGIAVLVILAASLVAFVVLSFAVRRAADQADDAPD